MCDLGGAILWVFFVHNVEQIYEALPVNWASSSRPLTTSRQEPSDDDFDEAHFTSRKASDVYRRLTGWSIISERGLVLSIGEQQHYGAIAKNIAQRQ